MLFVDLGKQVVIQTLVISLVSFPHGGLVQGVPIISSTQDNIIEGQNKSHTINATSIERNNDLHKQSMKLLTVNSTTGYPTVKPLLITGHNNKKLRAPNTTNTLPPSLPTTVLPGPQSTSITITPPMKHKSHSFRVKILEYVLIPVGFLIVLVISYCLVRHIQRVRRKHRLERELMHQYSYPNSEADDMENEQNITEIDSIVNTQFVAYNDHNDKTFSDTPQVTIVGGAIPAVKQNTEDLEQSTSLNT